VEHFLGRPSKDHILQLQMADEPRETDGDTVGMDDGVATDHPVDLVRVAVAAGVVAGRRKLVAVMAEWLEGG
jgi:hypothetical protein